MKPFPENKTVAVDDELTLECRVLGYPHPEVSWLFNPDIDNDHDAASYKPLNPGEDSRVTFKDVTGYKHQININQVKDGDEGTYKCVARNTLEGKPAQAERAARVRVKDNLAWLWPLIGIVCQAVVLGLIVMCTELRQKKREAARHASKANNGQGRKSGDVIKEHHEVSTPSESYAAFAEMQRLRFDTTDAGQQPSTPACDKSHNSSIESSVD